MKREQVAPSREIEATVGGEKMPDNMALTIDQAADCLNSMRESEAPTEQAAADAAFLESLGIDPANPAEPPQGEAKPEVGIPTSTEQPPGATEQPASEPQTFEAQFARAVESEAVKAIQADYARQIETATRSADAAFVAAFPEFRGVTDPNHVASIATSIAAQNPQRFATMVQAVQSTQALIAEAQHATAWAWLPGGNGPTHWTV